VKVMNAGFRSAASQLTERSQLSKAAGLVLVCGIPRESSSPAPLRAG